MPYHVEYIPTDGIEALADKRGRPSPDESPLDYCEADDAARVVRAETFPDAVKAARAWLPSDYFGQVRIERVVMVRSRYGDRVAAEAVWFLCDAADELDEDAPEFIPDMNLILDERIEPLR